MAGVLSATAFGEGRCGRRGQVEQIVQLAIGEQAAVGGDPGPVEFELEAAVERDPQGWCLGFTRRVHHQPSDHRYVSDPSGKSARRVS